jgi:chromosome segregation ATPase
MARVVQLVLLGALLGLCSGSSVSPVQKVIQLIDDMKAKVEADGKAADDEFAQYAKWCDDEADDKARSIKTAQDEIAELQATSADATATIATLEAKIGELTTTIASTESEASAAADNRKGGHKDFLGAEDELVHTVDTLGHDAELIKKETSFVQGGKMPKRAEDKVERMLAGMDKIVEANWVTTAQKSEVSAFLQSRQAEKDGDTELQEPAAYESSSGGILGAIQGMEEKAEDSLGSERKQEMKDLNAYQLLKMSLENELKNLKAELGKASSKKQFTTQELANAQKSLAQSQKGLSEDSSSLRDLKRECQTKAGEYEEEFKDRQNELGALGKAKEIMESKFSFLQTKTTVRVHSTSRMATRQNEDRKEQALKLLHTLGKNLGSTVLVSLSFRALADPFAKVKKMIEEMVTKLLAEAAEEADQKAFCDKELGETNKATDTKQGKLDTVNARMEKATSRTEIVAEEVRVLSKELAEIDAASAEATAIRNEEKGSFDKASKDYSESQEACAAAIEVLRAYYESGSFVQVSAKTRAQSQAQSKAKDAGGILGMLEVAESDFSRLLSEAKAAEQASADEYETMMQENKVLKATKNAEVKGKKSEVASLGTALENYGEDKDGLTKELGALNDYLDKLKPQCETQVPTYEERKLRREKEIDGLKEALSVLEGEGVPVALLQKSVKTTRHA